MGHGLFPLCEQPEQGPEEPTPFTSQLHYRRCRSFTFGHVESFLSGPMGIHRAVISDSPPYLRRDFLRAFGRLAALRFFIGTMNLL